MKIRLLVILAWSVAAIIVLQPAVLNATSIGVSLRETRTTPTFGTAFNQLDGQLLNGQTLSLDFVFTDNFVRFLPPGGLPQTGTDFDISVYIATNASLPPGEFVGFATGTGFIFDQAGHALETSKALGSFVDSAGGIGLGLFPFFADRTGAISNEIARNASFYGFHMDITLPNNSQFQITDANLGLFGGNIPRPNHPGEFAIGPHVPDAGSTMLLLAIAVLPLCRLPLRP
jgi:hypothetical protein